MKEVIVYGIDTDYTYEVNEILQRLGITVRAYVRNIETRDPMPRGIEPVVSREQIESSWLTLPVVIPITTPGYLLRAVADARRLGFSSFPHLADPSSVVARSCQIDEGSVVNALVAVAAETRLGRFVTLNRCASVGHHTRIGDYAFVGPSATICGRITMEAGAYVGAGAVINPGLHIGANAVVGAGAVVTRSVDPNTVVVGSPARVVKEYSPGFDGVGVGISGGVAMGSGEAVHGSAAP